MKFHPALLVPILFSIAASAADVPPGHPPMDVKKPVQGTPAAQLPQKGKVLSVINVPSYTYLEVAQDKKTLWIAGPTMAAKKGDVVRFEDGMVMSNFHSKTLNRDFASIAFVSQIVVTKE